MWPNCQETVANDSIIKIGNFILIICSLKVRVKRDPPGSPPESLPSLPLVSTCDESGQYRYDRERDGKPVGSYKREDGSCSATVLNFDLPFAMALHHGQVLVKIEGQMPIEANIKLHGIEDTGKNFIHREEHVRRI